MAEPVSIDVPIDSDGAYSLMFGYGDSSSLSLVLGFRKKSTRTVLQAVRDMNGDGIVDLVTHSLEGRSVLKQRSRYEVHFGKQGADGIAFDTNVAASVQPRGRAGAIQAWGYSAFGLYDFDGDGQVDIFLSHIKTGIGGMARALVGNSVVLDLEIYRMQAGRYPSKPTFKRRIKPRFRPFSDRDALFFPVALVGDVTGDGRLDLVFGQSRQALFVLVGAGGTELFAHEPQEVTAELPRDLSRDMRLLDINDDQKQDLLFHHRSDTEPHWVTLLIAK